MNYGYQSLGRPADAELLKLLEPIVAEAGKASTGKKPYLEMNGLYDGVRIRAITDLPEEALDLLIQKADQVYEKVCNQRKAVGRREFATQDGTKL